MGRRLLNAKASPAKTTMDVKRVRNTCHSSTVDPASREDHNRPNSTPRPRMQAAKAATGRAAGAIDLVYGPADIGTPPVRFLKLPIIGAHGRVGHFVDMPFHSVKGVAKSEGSTRSR